jgi:hypothetical protein
MVYCLRPFCLWFTPRQHQVKVLRIRMPDVDEDKGFLRKILDGQVALGNETPAVV